MPKPLVTITAPVYNESAIIDAFVDEIFHFTSQLSNQYQFEILLVNDGSNDGTGEKLNSLCEKYRGCVRAVHLARNFGHAAACMACLDHARGDAVILMDSDLQDDPAAIPTFLQEWEQGAQVVYAVRSRRRESFPFRMLFFLFYRLLRLFSSIHIPSDAGNFSLLDRRVVEHFKSHKEKNAYLPGLRAYFGFRQVGIPVPRRERYDHSSRVGIRGLMSLAINAFFSFSYLPIRLLQLLGALILVFSSFLLFFILYSKYVTHTAVTAWSSQMTTILFFGGINVLGIGIIGEYLARIFDQIRNRPHYTINHITGEIPGEMSGEMSGGMSGGMPGECRGDREGS